MVTNAFHLLKGHDCWILPGCMWSQFPLQTIWRNTKTGVLTFSVTSYLTILRRFTALNRWLLERDRNHLQSLKIESIHSSSESYFHIDYTHKFQTFSKIQYQTVFYVI